MEQYLLKVVVGHINNTKHVLHYLIGTSYLDIEFSPVPKTNTEDFVSFPLPPNKVISLYDTNCGPQD